MDLEYRTVRPERSAPGWRVACVLLVAMGFAWACHAAGDAVSDVIRAK